MMRVFIVSDSEPNQIDTVCMMAIDTHNRTSVDTGPKQVDDAFINIYDKWKVAIWYGPSSWSGGFGYREEGKRLHQGWYFWMSWIPPSSSCVQPTTTTVGVQMTRIHAELMERVRSVCRLHVSVYLCTGSLIGFTFRLLDSNVIDGWLNREPIYTYQHTCYTQCCLPSDKWTDLYTPNDDSKQ